ncbi:MAG: hypothetical protein CVV47_10860 [Spirochaetae bacterium HGW-Spirochaetae-3]|jgi:hypothetical protein|nr:MAG: hypothetical protein CVV47_10860 [Spirochaetae bacterium HGW-Spirochaetae-3]
MDALRDTSWMRELYTFSPAERFQRGRFTVVSIAPSQTASHHNERYRFRLFFFEDGGSRPVMTLDLESDILGTWRLTVTTAMESRIVTSFDEAPDYEAFKAAALAIADAEIGAVRPAPRVRGRPPVRRIP